MVSRALWCWIQLINLFYMRWQIVFTGAWAFRLAFRLADCIFNLVSVFFVVGSCMWVRNEIVKCDRPTNIRYFVHCFPLADSHFWIGIALISYCDARYCWKSNLLSFHWNCSHKTSIIQIYAEIKCIRRSLCRIHTYTPTTPFNQKQNFQNLITAQKWAPSAEFVVVVAMEAYSIVCVPVPFVECYLCNRPMCTVIHWYVKIAQISNGDTFESNYRAHGHCR